jgi:hypothetical protein
MVQYKVKLKCGEQYMSLKWNMSDQQKLFQGYIVLI